MFFFLWASAITICHPLEVIIPSLKKLWPWRVGAVVCQSPDEASSLPCSPTWICQTAGPQNSRPEGPLGLPLSDIVSTGQHTSVVQDWNVVYTIDKKNKAFVLLQWDCIPACIFTGSKVIRKKNGRPINQTYNSESFNSDWTQAKIKEGLKILQPAIALSLFSWFCFSCDLCFQSISFKKKKKIFGSFLLKEHICLQFSRAIIFRAVWFWYSGCHLHKIRIPGDDSSDAECTPREQAGMQKALCSRVATFCKMSSVIVLLRVGLPMAGLLTWPLSNGAKPLISR